MVTARLPVHNSQAAPALSRLINKLARYEYEHVYEEGYVDQTSSPSSLLSAARLVVIKLQQIDHFDFLRLEDFFSRFRIHNLLLFLQGSRSSVLCSNMPFPFCPDESLPWAACARSLEIAKFVVQLLSTRFCLWPGWAAEDLPSHQTLTRRRKEWGFVFRRRGLLYWKWTVVCLHSIHSGGVAA